MLNEMMNPELIKLAQDQLSRLSADETAALYKTVFANLEQLKAASESVTNTSAEAYMRDPENFKNTYQEIIAQMSKGAVHALPEENAAGRAKLLKEKGNEHHNQGKFREAAEKYVLAKKTLEETKSPGNNSLLASCSLNLMSCYLKLKKFDECITEGFEVLGKDMDNVKALYRRGQAYKELARWDDAASDLKRAHQISPDDETIADVLRFVEEKCRLTPNKLIIEEMAEENGLSSFDDPQAPALEGARAQSHESGELCNTQSMTGGLPTDSESVRALKDDRDCIRPSQSVTSDISPGIGTASDGGKGQISPEVLAIASDMIRKMPPGDLQRLLPNSLFGQPPNLTPEMVRTASEMMSKMSPGEITSIFQHNPLLRAAGPGSSTASNASGPRAPSTCYGDDVIARETSSSGEPSSSELASRPMFAQEGNNMQEQMINQMKDPAARQMFNSMVKNITPEIMLGMSEQFGLKLSQEDAEKAHKAMSSLSPDDLERMMKLAGGIQKTADCVRKAKSFLLGKPGMLLAVCMLVLAIVLHWLGYIGK